MFDTDKTVLVIVDVQGKLAMLMHDRGTLFGNLRKLVLGAKALNIPIVWVEQNPARMGETIPELRDVLVGLQPVSKLSFSCCGEASFVNELNALGRRQVLIAGIEAHVCVYQTACNLVGQGYEVKVVADAVSSRTLSNRDIAIEMIKACRCGITSVEAILFELLKTSEHPAFKQILEIVK